MATAKKSAGTTTATEETSQGFTAEERAAMKERAKEIKSAKRRGGKVDDQQAVLDKIAEMPDPDRTLAERLHAMITATAPDLGCKLWYGMPAYTLQGKTICFFQPASKFQSRYATLGFDDRANLDEGAMWPTAFALTSWTSSVEEQVAALIKKAVG